jgi:hypothetical protein
MVSTTPQVKIAAGTGMMIAAVLIAGGGLVWLSVYPPTTTDWFPKCVFHQATGLHCPGCGGTRAVLALARGQWLLAIRSNPMLILGVPAMLILVGLQRCRERAGGKASPRLALTLFAILIVYFVVRNVPSPSTSPLAPPPGMSAEFL